MQQVDIEASDEAGCAEDVRRDPRDDAPTKLPSYDEVNTAVMDNVSREARQFQQNAYRSCWFRCLGCIGYTTSFMVGMVTFVSLPWVLLQVRLSYVNRQRMIWDGRTLHSLRSFRDIPWESLGWLHHAFSKDSKAYIAFTVFVFLGNAILWYYWFPRRYFVDRQWHLLVALYLLLAFSFLSNCLTWWPPPSLFVQDESVLLNCLFGLAQPFAHSFFSPRLSFSFLLAYDFTRSCNSSLAGRVNHCGRVAWLGVFVFLDILYLYTTRQVYTGSLVSALSSAVAARSISIWFLEKVNRCLSKHNTRAATTSGLYFGYKEEEDGRLTLHGKPVQDYNNTAIEITSDDDFDSNPDPEDADATVSVPPPATNPGRSDPSSPRKRKPKKQKKTAPPKLHAPTDKSSREKDQADEFGVSMMAYKEEQGRRSIEMQNSAFSLESDDDE